MNSMSPEEKVAMNSMSPEEKVAMNSMSHEEKVAMHTGVIKNVKRKIMEILKNYSHKIEFPKDEPTTFSFQVDFRKGSRIPGALIHFPLGSKTLEMALIGEDGAVMTDDNLKVLGYLNLSGVRQFHNCSGIAEELRRLDQVLHIEETLHRRVYSI